VCANRRLDVSRNYVVEIHCFVIEKACGMQGGKENCLQRFGHEETTYGSQHIFENTVREMG
jgi:hypothetical protein